MADETEHPESTTPETPVVEKVGEILHRERVARRIAVEAIARDLKLNVKHIKSLEALEYDQLPGEPYLRVYLRAIAKYLGMDPDEVLKKYLAERGENPAEYKTSPHKITISMERSDKPRIPWAIIGVLGGVLLIAGYVGSRMGGTSPAQPAVTVVKKDSLQSAVTPDSSREDSLPAEQIKPIDSTALADSTAKKRDSLVLTIQGVKDSSWVQAYADGKVQRVVIRAKENRRFAAMDSFNIRVGNHRYLEFTLNGKPVERKSIESSKGVDIAIFKIDHKGTTAWSAARWVAVFK